MNRRVPLSRRTPMAPGRPLARHSRKAAEKPRKPARRTGFPPAVRQAVRERARLRCEGCGTWLGDHDGELQHRVARGRGGSRRPVISSVVNALLLCHVCHMLAESRDRHSHEAGLWLWSWQDPAAEPVLLQSAWRNGSKVWLTPDGRYSTEPPEGVSAA
ncbi:MAG: hypothetical protein J2P30_01670 [Actinobacteria bacterium]|nr:hypothetical protein [Actinomycetota bacterium]